MIVLPYGAAIGAWTRAATLLPEKLTIDGKLAPEQRRGYGQLWDGASSTDPAARAVLESAFGVTLLNAVDAYRETDRAIKYGVMFIALTFACSSSWAARGRRSRNMD